MLRKPHVVALSAVVLLALIILSLPSKTAGHLKLALGGFFFPLLGLAGSAHSVKETASNALLPRRVLLDQIEQLRRENQNLQLELNQALPLWEENHQLRQALDWQKRTRWNLKAARVILRDPANWWRMVHIDRGQRDGVAVNMPVLTTEGLVGRIDQVGLTTSQVLLIGDPNCQVSAVVVTGNARAHGVVTSSSLNLLDPTLVDFTYMDRQSPIKPGDRVSTSGLGGYFPAEILVGHVVATNSVDFGLYTEARVKLAANLKNLEMVWVKFP